MAERSALERSRRNYAELRSKWVEALEGNHRNAIWEQMVPIANDEVWFRTVMRIRNRAEHPPLNGYLWNAFLTGYAIKQSFAIRRLTDTKKGTGSLLRIVKEIESNAHLLTREIVVCHDGTQLDVEPLFNQMGEPASDPFDQADGKAHTGIMDPKASARCSAADFANGSFDRLRDDPLDAPRFPTDRISTSVIERLKEALTGAAIKRVRDQCDQYLAHADLSDLADVTINPIYNDIHDSIQTLIQVRQFLRCDPLDHSSGTVVATYQDAHLSELSAPLVPPFPQEVYREAWDQAEEEVEGWGDVGQFRRFAIHPTA